MGTLCVPARSILLVGRLADLVCHVLSEMRRRVQRDDSEKQHG
jgi:hypothetical protein